MSSGRLFVIGIDGVDIKLAKSQGLLLKSHISWDLENYPELHTLRIWPSMFLGDYPHQSSELSDPLSTKENNNSSSSANWYSQRMRIFSQLSSFLLPKAIRKRIGRFLIHNNMAKTEPDRNDWQNTIFDQTSSKAINIPTYNPLKIQKSLKEGWQTKVKADNAGLEQLEDLAQKERKEVWDELNSAFDYGYDLTWAYVYGTDIFGHIDFNHGYPRQVTKVKEEVIDKTMNRMDEDDKLVIISDHGMKEEDGVGVHRPPGWLATSWETEDLPQNPPEVRKWLEAKISARSDRVDETLRDLGYIE